MCFCFMSNILFSIVLHLRTTLSAILSVLKVVLKILLKFWTNMIWLSYQTNMVAICFGIIIFSVTFKKKKKKNEAYLCVRHSFFQWNQLSDSDFRLTALCQGFWVVELALLAHLLEKEEARVSDSVFDLDTFAASICEYFFLGSVHHRYDVLLCMLHDRFSLVSSTSSQSVHVSWLVQQKCSNTLTDHGYSYHYHYGYHCSLNSLIIFANWWLTM